MVADAIAGALCMFGLPIVLGLILTYEPRDKR